MRAVVTRVTSASVEIGGEVRGSIGKGFLVLLGVNVNDTEAEAKKARDRFVDAGRPQAVQEEAGALEIETERA